MATVTTYSKRKPVQRLRGKVNDIFEEKEPFSSDSSIVDNTRSTHQQKDKNHANNDQSTDKTENDGSDQEVFLSLSKSLMLKRTNSDEYSHKSKHPSMPKKTTKFAEPELFQDPVSTTPSCKHPRTRHLKAGIKQSLRDGSNTIKHVVNRRSKVTMPQQLLFGRLATRKPIRSPRLQPPRYVNTYRAPVAESGTDTQEGESSQESDTCSQPLSHSQSGVEDEASDCTDYTSTYTWTSATGSTDVLVAQYPSIELPRRQVAVQEHVDPPLRPLYVVRDAKERDFDQTDVSNLSQVSEDCCKVPNANFGEDCANILNSTLLDDGCAKNIQDVSIMVSPIPEYTGSPKRTGKSDIKDIVSTEEKEAKVPTGSLMEMKRCLETTPQAKKSIISPKTPLKVKSGKSKMGKLQPKSSTFIFAEDDYKHMTEYITVELSGIPKVHDQHKTSEMGFSPELKVVEQEFLTSTPVRGRGGMGRLPKENFSIDLSTVQAQSHDSEELQFHTSKIVNSAEIHVSSAEGIVAIPDSFVKLTHSPNISIPDIEVDCMASDKVCILETTPDHPVSVTMNNKPNEEPKKPPPMYQPAAYPLCVIVALPENTTATKENKILQWRNASKCSYRTLIENTPIDIFEALDV